MGETDVETVLAHPQTLIGTDAFTVDGHLGPRTPIHPRHFGTFPRVLGHYGRTRGVGDLATMVQKITGLPARKLRLTERGLLARGNWADVVVFDSAAISDRATAKEPYLEPVGLQWVIVNGRVAVRDGRVSEEKAGMILRG
jgi:N-acyl-D-amino-acid deacylase